MIAASGEVFSQEDRTTASRILSQEEQLTLGGYAQIDYNQPLDRNEFRTGTLDVHRLVFMLGYKFSDKLQFVSEVEIEHAKEIYVEQAFLQATLLPWMNFRAGLVLIPMGIVNELHEPPTFNGVERPNLDKYIVPSTWREIGAGISGTFSEPGLSYQMYLVNGFSGYDGNPQLNGSSGFRDGRQKGAGSYMHSPNLALRINYGGVQGLLIGTSVYMGKTQSTLYNGLDRSSVTAVATADSSVVGLTMLGADLRYLLGGMRIRAQVNYAWISGSGRYNEFTDSDLGSNLGGWYGEIAYDLFHSREGITSELIPFIRFEQYNTQMSTEGATIKDQNFGRTDITIGIGWKLMPGAMIKLDYQNFSRRGMALRDHQVNVGIGVWF